LKKIESLVQAGARIIGPKPVSVPGLGSSEDDITLFGEIANRLWGNVDGVNVKEHAYGSGKVFDGITPDEVLKKEGIAVDFYFDGTPTLDYIHRSSEVCEIYFVRNEADQWSRGKAQFRVTDRFPELWDPSTGKQYRIDALVKTKEHISFNLELPPHGSVFVVFNKRQRKLPLLESNFVSEQQIEGSWSVSFPIGWGAPAEVIFDKLQSWTDFEDAGIKYFSGTATYRKTFSISGENEGKKCYLDLGEVCDLAEVYVNGISAGILWKKPFSIDISTLLKTGENELKIEIVNLWANRLSGDLFLKPEERFCRTNQPWNEYIVLPSGLLGPVKLMFRK